MAKHLTPADKITLAKLKSFYKQKNDQQYSSWHEKILQEIAFKHGENDAQWLNKQANKEMDEKCIKRYTFNIVEPTVNKLVSVVLRLNLSMSVSSAYGTNTDLEYAEMINRWLLDIQNKNNFRTLLKFQSEDGISNGIGWLDYKMDEEYNVKIDYLKNTNVFFDYKDESYDYSEMEFIGYESWLSISKFKKLYQKKIDDIEDLFKDNDSSSSKAKNLDGKPYFRDELYENLYYYSGSYGDSMESLNDQWLNNEKIKTVNIYYRESRKYYEVPLVFEGAITKYKTFYKESAEKLTNNAVYGTGAKVEEKDGIGIFFGVFFKDILLYNEPLPAQSPNQQYLPIIPMLWKKNNSMPLGRIADFKYYQMIINETISKINHLSDAKIIILSNNGNDGKQVAQTVKDELGKKTSVLYTSNPTEIKIEKINEGIQYLNLLLNFAMDKYNELVGIDNQLLTGSGNNSGRSKEQAEKMFMATQTPLTQMAINSVKAGTRLLLDFAKGGKDFKGKSKVYKNGETAIKEFTKENLLSDFAVRIQPNGFNNTLFDDDKEKAMFVIQDPQLRSIARNSEFSAKLFGFENNFAHELAESIINADSGVDLQMKKIELEQQLQQMQSEIPTEMAQNEN